MQAAPENADGARGLHILLVGEIEKQEFLDAIALMRATASVTTARDLASAAAYLEVGRPACELIVLAVSYPWQFGARDLERLRSVRPIVPLVALMGSWLEGHQRTEASWRETPSVYWDQWPVFWNRECLCWRKSGQPVWNLPPTCSREQWFAALGLFHAGNSRTYRALDRISSKSTSDVARPSRLVALCGMPYETASALSDIVTRRGDGSVWLRRPQEAATVRGVGAIVWEGLAADPREIEQLRQYRARLDQPATVALLDFPRPDTVEALRSAGAREVLGKPFLVADLTAALDRMLERGAGQRLPTVRAERESAA